MNKYKDLILEVMMDLRTRFGELNEEASNDEINKAHTFGRANGIGEAWMIMLEKVKKEAPEILK